MYIVKHTIHKPGGDALLEFEAAPQNTALAEALYTYPGFLVVSYFRTEDREYGEMYFVWESEQSWTDWYAINAELHDQSLADIIAYCEEHDIIFGRFLPEGEDHDWSDPKWTDPNIILDSIEHSQIFE